MPWRPPQEEARREGGGSIGGRLQGRGEAGGHEGKALEPFEPRPFRAPPSMEAGTSTHSHVLPPRPRRGNRAPRLSAVLKAGRCGSAIGDNFGCWDRGGARGARRRGWGAAACTLYGEVSIKQLCPTTLCMLMV